MIYIEKPSINEPDSLKQFIKEQNQAGIHPAYRDLDKIVKNDLRQALVKAQGWLCCYCMNRITPDNSTIEHFLPQSQFKEEEVRYANLFLTCRYSRGKSKKEQHCDDKKGDELIPHYISLPSCENYFAYNSRGEILPNCDYRSIERCIKNYQNLTPTQQAVLATINILNLNASSLVTQRKSFIRPLISQVQRLNQNEIEALIVKYKQCNDGKLKRFCGVAIYFLADYLKRKFPKQKK